MYGDGRVGEMELWRLFNFRVLLRGTFIWRKLYNDADMQSIEHKGQYSSKSQMTAPPRFLKNSKLKREISNIMKTKMREVSMVSKLILEAIYML